MRSRKGRFTGHQFCPPPYRAKMRLHCKHNGQINWQFTFANSHKLPRHASREQLRAAVSRATSARPSHPRGRLASNYARPSREQLRAAVPPASDSARPSRERFGWEPADLRTLTVNISEIYLPCLNLPKLICFTLNISKYI